MPQKAHLGGCISLHDVPILDEVNFFMFKVVYSFFYYKKVNFGQEQ